MPYHTEWVAPELFIEHNGVKVWHVYKDDDSDNNGPRDYHFVLYLYDGEGGGSEFDVRKLSTWKDPDHPPYLDTKETNTPENREAWNAYHETGLPNAVKAAIMAAIDAGEIVAPQTRRTSHGRPYEHSNQTGS